MKKEYLGIDLGSENTAIYSSLTGSVIYSEPTCIALDRYTREVKEVGFLASRVAGKTPYNFEVIFPVRDGVVVDDEACYLYLSEVLKSLKVFNRNRLPALVFAVPSDCSKVNRKVLIELGKQLGTKEIYIESQAKLAALGAGKNVFSPTATMICHIGSGVSDIACLSLGEIVSAASSFVAGNSFNEAIRRYMMQKQHLAIGLKSAEYLKMRIGNLSTVPENRLAEVKGRDTITSLPSSIVVSSGEIRACLEPLANMIGLKITDVIASLPPELAADLTKNGIILSGGGSLVAGMKDYFENLLSIPVRVVDKPLEVINEGFAVYNKVINK
ncbi:MAG: rod shape-determining protein [Bacilli bacterium]|jgi:rod shape-determining protein MreB|nr:rod shape-determining protein [Bacilli bacterium]